MQPLTIYATSYYLTLIASSEFKKNSVSHLGKLKQPLFESLTKKCEVYAIEGLTKHQLPIRLTNLIMDLILSSKQTDLNYDVEQLVLHVEKCINSCLSGQQELVEEL
ncbi:hypothetical protein JQC92_08375 [Shewanella sp. 202IG2-18]|uniref:hypothetical protein n=1 Tax=Parashewanella hymeniacidonis TaxID=2807618 RepID=UPI001961752F|nr:hypothetical protein [Parashewanella hymeniacidonis]MBM7072043.1 hypothetical protein [Parashewanella hymeniacidonis]